jgi:DNA primase
MKDNSNLDLIRERLNILDVVSTYIRVDKAGNSFRARCPFHNEKTPSFYVSPGRGSYHCFGCNEHGDIFGFIMKIEGIQFKDALRILADKAGVTLSTFKKEEQSHLVDICEAATLFFEKNLTQENQAQEYLKKRGVKTETIQKFRIGFAPNDWRQLYHLLSKAGYTDDEIVTSGLCIKHEKGLYDRFRSRIMFPIMNASGKVVAFSGRIIGADEGKEGVAKYVNSPETPMYHKSSILFGYNFAKTEIAKQKKVYVVEGQMDVVMTHQAGYVNTVAISGTAFTPEHINILKRFTDYIILALDSDKAGYTAMLKSASLALSMDMEVDGVIMSEKDPADMIKTDPGSWEKVVEDTKPIVNIISQIIIKKESIKPRQMQMLRRELFPLLRVVKSPLLKQTFVEEVAKELGFPKEIILEEVKSVDTVLEIPKKKEVRKVNVSQMQHLGIALASIEVLFSEHEKNKFLDVLKKYLAYSDSLTVENFPKEILEKEIFQIEKLKEENKEMNLVKQAADSVYLFIRKIIDERILSLKEKIKNGEDVETNLLLVQNLTKSMLLLKQEIYG